MDIFKNGNHVMVYQNHLEIGRKYLQKIHFTLQNGVKIVLVSGQGDAFV